jgi:hypothetical protein
VQVKPDQPTSIVLHQEIAKKRAVSGRILLDQGASGSLKDGRITVYSTDDNYHDQQSLSCAADGSFKFETYAATISAVARMADGKALGWISDTDTAKPLEIHLKPTLDYLGLLLDRDGQASKGRGISAHVMLEGTKKTSRNLRAFEVLHLIATTDAEGNFTLHGVPSEMRVILNADAADGSRYEASLGTFSLAPGESRPRSISKPNRTNEPAEKIPLASRYQSTLRDASLSGYRTMVVIADDSSTATAFVDRNYLDSEVNRDAYLFMQIMVAAGQQPLDEADLAFVKDRHWPQPQQGRVVAIALDGDGKEFGRQEVQLSVSDAPKQVAEFIHQYAPERHNAEEKWQAALDEAAKTNRRVWVRISGRYCGPCFMLTRWLDDQQKLLAKDYVLLKIDSGSDTQSEKIVNRLLRDQQLSIPFSVIFDASSKLLVDSVGPLGNVGFPSGDEGKRQLRKMLLQTRQNLTDAEIDRLVESVK